MENQLAVQTTFPALQEFAEQFTGIEKLTNTHLTWMHFGERRRFVMKRLEAGNLYAQSIRLEMKKAIEEKTATITWLEEKCGEYVKAYKKVKDELRIPFTTEVSEKIVKPMMKDEKDIDPETNEEFKSITAFLLQMKKEDREAKQKILDKQQEGIRYIAHINTENIERIREYKVKCLGEISSMYSSYLKNKVENPDIEIVRNTISEISLRKPNPFKREHLTDEEALQIRTKIAQDGKMPDVEALKAEQLKVLDEKFAHYKDDLAQVKVNAEAENQIWQQAIKERDKIENDAKIQTGVQATMASAQPMEIKQEGKKIKQKIEIVYENSNEWLANVHSCFHRIPNWQVYTDKIEKANIKAEQLARFIGEYAMETGKKFDEFTYKTTEK